MISSALASVSAMLLGVGGVVLLFASDAVVPRLIPGYPPDAAWTGQLLAAAWLGVAAIDWLQRRAVMGGIYGRPVVLANLVLYFVSALSLLRVSISGRAPVVVLAALLASAAMATGYAVLLVRGPFERQA